jgi:hypothetical protein
MLSFCVTGTWTAFETMAGDLWEAALNVHPQGLAELKGTRKRITRGTDSDSSRGQEDPEIEKLKSVPLNEILRHEFKIENRMGTVLRTKQRFDHLVGIREAYGLAFFKNTDDIDAVLKEDVFDALNTIRNLIVHRSGVVDTTYERKSKFLKIPSAPVGSPIFLDGETVVHLMRAVTARSLHLLTSVDAWITAN